MFGLLRVCRRGFCSQGSAWRSHISVSKAAWEFAWSQYTKHSELEQLMVDKAGTLEMKEMISLGKRAGVVADLAMSVGSVKQAAEELADVYELVEETHSRGASPDPEMYSAALKERDQCEAELARVQDALLEKLIPPDDDASRNAILEVRAGTGGEEAALFAMEIFHMYEKYSRRTGWDFKTLEVSPAEQGGFKEASALITGENVFSRLKYETGAHRVQRVPATESQGRVHTSAMTVAVLPEAEEVDVVINKKDLRIDTYRSRGAGGQSVNTTDSAVRITHLPTGIVVACQDERSQMQNREKGMKILYSRIYAQQREKLQEERANMRSAQIGSGDRSERIRTYNFPQSRVTDHRTKSTKTGVDKMLNGELLDEFVLELKREDSALFLKSLGEEDS